MKHEARELMAYINSNVNLMKRLESYYRLMEAKRARRLYDAAKAPRGLMTLLSDAAREYCREYGVPRWWTMFDTTTREEAAEGLIYNMHVEWDCGNFWTPARAEQKA